ncbi:MAG: phosphatase PAP2 family protein [Acidobacteriales bacterium]|nr:phosphatase PAP2 family protein [Terriglobales bacterium]
MVKLKGGSADEPGLWAADRLMIAYLAATALLIAVFRHRIPAAVELLWWHAAGIAVLLGVPRLSGRFPALVWWRYFCPILYVAACYREMSVLIRSIRGTDYDAAMAHMDILLWGTHPMVLLSGIQSPWLTEALQLAYSLFIPAVLLACPLLWKKREWEELRYYSFLIALGFLVSYAGYLLVPVRGPRFHLPSTNLPPLEGLWLFDRLRSGLDWLESAHYDCFPSGHVQLTVMACGFSKRRFPVLFLIFLPYTFAVVFATVYLRYHYTVDVAAGALTAGVLLWAGPRLYIMARRTH